MQISLNETEIQQALIEYINNKGINLTNCKTDVVLTAGRGPNGHSAAISIEHLNGPESFQANEDADAGSKPAITFAFSGADTE